MRQRPALETRIQVVHDLLAHARWPNRLLEERGRRVGVSGRTLRRWLEQYRQGGRAALAPRYRPGPGRPRRLDARLSALIRQAYLETPRPAVAEVHRQVVACCRQAGLSPPSYQTVWRECLLLAAASAAPPARDRRPASPPDSPDSRLGGAAWPAPRPPRLRRERRIALIFPATSRYFWPQVQAGVCAAQQLLAPRGTRVDWIPAGATLDGQRLSAAVERAARDGYDAIGVVAISDELCDTIYRVARRGIPIATFNADTSYGEETGALFYAGQDGALGGELAARVLVERCAGPGKVAILTASRHAPVLEARRTAFERFLRAHSELTVIGHVQYGQPEARAYHATIELLRREPGLRAIYVTNGDVWLAARAIEDLGLRHRIVLVGFDLLAPTARSLQRGTLAGTIDQDPFAEGYLTAIWLHNALMAGTKPASYHCYTPARVIKPPPQ